MDAEDKQTEELDRQRRVRMCLRLLNWSWLDFLYTPVNRITREYVRAGIILARSLRRGKSAYCVAQFWTAREVREYANCGFCPVSDEDFGRVVAGESLELLVPSLQVPASHNP